ncbi:MAG TPA: RluA family pseudouridine synthase [Spirochaetia bacterium]|nr:RluA family pseudouridine synthase [Spirochaetia bacterium]
MVGQSLTVLYEDETFIVIDKPEGVHTAPLTDGEPDTLQALVLSAFPEIAAVPGVKPFEHGLLHRLDRSTSGVVVVARTPAAFAALRAQFSSEQVRKEYRAACVGRSGRISEEKFSVTSRFAPAGSGRRMVRVVMPDETNRKLLGKATRRDYTTEANIISREGNRALLGVVIRKGFRHQVRAHLSCAGWPIIGDELYGVAIGRGAPAPLVQRRLYLHAIAVSLTHPVTGQPLRIVSPLPETFTTVISSRSG